MENKVYLIHEEDYVKHIRDKDRLFWLLKRMRKIEGGKELSRQIAADWRIRYKNRRAMMDELKGLYSYIYL